MKVNRLLFVSMLVVMVVAVAVFGYFYGITPFLYLKSVISKRKSLLVWGGLAALIVIMLGVSSYYFRTIKTSEKGRGIMRVNPLLFFGVLISAIVVSVAAIGLSQTVLSNQSTAKQPIQSSPLIPYQDVLTVNYPVVKHPFTNKLLGVNFVNWEHSWGKPNANQVKGLAEALKAAHVGLIRYAGGNWSNSVGWDRSTARTPYTGWPDAKNGPYWFQYNPAEIDSVAALAQSVGADVLIEVNISTNDPAMWADLVKYTNIEHKYGFKYWELGNELDTSKTAPNPDEYVQRAGNYIDAMMDVDAAIKITAAGVASPYDAPRLGYDDKITNLSPYLTKSNALVSPKGRKIKALSYHWYQACNSTDEGDLTRYAWDGLADNSWRNNYSRKELDLMPERIISDVTNANIPQGITEFNFDTCNYDNPMNGNFLNALWTTDALGRMAYNGVDFAIRWQGYGTQAFSMLYANDSVNPTQLYARPAYYAYLMYANYFGDQVLESSTNDTARLSMWASRDSSDSNSLKLMITNLSNTDIATSVRMPGFTASAANIYQMRSANPTDSTSTSLTSTVTINGFSIDLTNIDTSLAAIKPVSLPVAGSAFDYKFPAYSTTAIVLKGDFGPIPTPDPKAGPTPTIGFLPTATLLPAPTFTVSSTTAVNSVKPGQSLDITTIAKVDNAAADLLVDTEVYCSSDNVNWTKDFQSVHDNQKFSPGQTQSYIDAFAVSANHSKSQCVIKIGLFSPGWKKNLVFNDAGVFTIEDKIP